MYKYVAAPTTQCLAYLMQENPNCELEMIVDTYVHMARNHLVSAARLAEATHLLFIDSDMAFSPHTLDRLLRHDRQVVGCAARIRRPPFQTNVKELVGDTYMSLPVGSGLQQVDLLGTAIVLIKMEVFDVVPEPWFTVGGDVLGEDANFSRKCTAHGVDLWCDWQASKEVRHLVSYWIGLENQALSDRLATFPEAHFA